MASHLSSQVHVHASNHSPANNITPSPDMELEQEGHTINIRNLHPPPPPELSPAVDPVDYLSRAQWLRAAVLGANDGLVSVASLMIGVGAVNQTHKAMLVSGLAGLVAGACSMAIGEFVSVYAQYDIQVAEMMRKDEGGEDVAEESEGLPSPTQAAAASALAFSAGALLPLLAGGFVRPWSVRVAMVCTVTSLGLAGFGAAGALLGGANVKKSAVRVLLGGWMAMAVCYGVLRLFGLAFGAEQYAAA